MHTSTTYHRIAFTHFFAVFVGFFLTACHVVGARRLQSRNLVESAGEEVDDEKRPPK